MSNHTFVIPAYKESPYLELCIQNLLKQSVKSQITITTSTPSKYSEQLAKKYQLNYIINTKTTTSIANDWNFAIAQANTQYVTIAHQDDIYEEKFTEEVMNNLAKNPNTIIAFTNYSDIINGEVVNKSLNKFIKHLLLLPFKFKTAYKSKFVKKIALCFGSSICCPTVTYNKEVLKDFKFSNEYVVALDWFAWLEIAKRNGKFLYVNNDLVKHRIHNESETTLQLNNGKRSEEELIILRQIWGNFFGTFIAKIYSLGHKGNKY